MTSFCLLAGWVHSDAGWVHSEVNPHFAFLQYDPLCTTVLIAQVAKTLTLDLTSPCSNPGYWIHIYDILLPACCVSTQWLSSSKWLTRGGRRSRCVHFCAMYSQCLPKTVTSTSCRGLVGDVRLVSTHPCRMVKSVSAVGEEPRQCRW